MKSKAEQEFKIGFSRCDLEDSLDKTTVTNKEAEVNEERSYNKRAEAIAKVEDHIEVLKVKVSQ